MRIPKIKSEAYNLAQDCIDKHAQSLVNKHKTALIYVREDPAGSLKEPPLKLDFSSLQGLTNCFAGTLQDLGFKAGERLVLRLPNCAEFPISFLGAVKAGLIPVPTSPLLTQHELEFILKDSEASSLVMMEDGILPDLLKNRPPSLRQILILTRQDKEAPDGALRWQNLMKEGKAQFETRPTRAEDPAFWLYTSGTAGVPKAVIHAHRNIPAHDARAKVWQDLRAGDVIFNTSSLNWSYALTGGMLDVWRHGLTSVIFHGSPRPELLCRIIQRLGVSTFMSVPGIFRRIADYLSQTGQGLSGLRVCLSAGEKLSEEVRDRFHKATGLRIYEGLGMTEHSVYLVQPHGEPVVAGSCGRPLPGQRIAVLREDLSEAQAGEPGILSTHRSCPGLMLGYHHRPEEEKEAFRGEWFLSGDLAYRDDADNYFFLGRRDDVITAGGYRISPLEVESVLNGHPSVAESAVIGKEVELGKTLVIAFVVLETGNSPSQDGIHAILEECRKNLAPYKVPREIRFMSELPKTSNGKLRRKSLLGDS